MFGKRGEGAPQKALTPRQELDAMLKRREKFVGEVESIVSQLQKHPSVTLPERELLHGLLFTLRGAIATPADAPNFEQADEALKKAYEDIRFGHDISEHLAKDIDDLPPEVVNETAPEDEVLELTEADEVKEEPPVVPAADLNEPPQGPDTVIPDRENHPISRTEWKTRMKGMFKSIGEYTSRTVERTSKIPGYLATGLVDGGKRIAELVQSKEKRGEVSEKTKAMKAFLQNRYKEQYKGKAGSEILKQAKVDLLAMGKWYNDLPFKTKVRVGAAFGAASLVASIGGGGLSWLWLPAAVGMGGRRLLGGIGTYVAIEAALKKGQAFESKKYGNAYRHGTAAVAGFAVATGGAGWLIKEGGELIGHGIAHIFEHRVPVHEAPAAPAHLPGATKAPVFNAPPPQTVTAPSIADIPIDTSSIAANIPNIGPVAPDVSAAADANIVEGPSVADATPPAATAADTNIMEGPNQAATEPPSVGAAEAPIIAPNENYPTSPIEATIAEENGEGADQLFLDLKANLRAAGYSTEHGPPEIRALMGMRAHEISGKYGFLEGGNHPIMHQGETVSVNENGQLMFKSAHGEPEVLKPFEPTAPAEPAAAPAETPQQAAPVSAADTTVAPPAPVATPDTYTPPPFDPNSDTLPAYTGPTTGAPHETIGAATSGDTLPAYNPQGASAAEHMQSAPQAAPPAPELQLATSFPSIDAITHSPSWNTFSTQESWVAVFNVNLNHYDAPAMALRNNLFTVMRDTGVGFKPGEKIADYLTRAAAIAAEQKEAPAPLGIFEVNGQYIAHGGDLMARENLVVEFDRLHPGIKAVIADRNQLVTTTSIARPDGTWETHNIGYMAPAENAYVKKVL